MSTPKLVHRDSSFVIKKESFDRNFQSRERTSKDSEFFLPMKKRFKIQPYSSFEDRFIEQEKINKYVYEKILSLSEKLANNSEKKDFNAEIERVKSLYEILQKKLENLNLEFQDKNLLFTDILELKQVLIKKISKDQQFKGKANEKNKILFSEIVRIGQNIENCEKNILALEKRMRNQPTSSSSENFVEIENKLKVLEENIAKASQILNTDQQDIFQIRQSTENIKKELENYLIDLQSVFKSQISTTMNEITKKIEIEGDERHKNSLDFKYILDIKSQFMNEKFSGDVSYIKQEISKLEAFVNLELRKNQEFLGYLNTNFEEFSKNF